VDDQPVLVAAEIKDDSVVAHEIDSVTKLALYLDWIGPTRFGCSSEPRADRAFSLRMTCPELL